MSLPSGCSFYIRLSTERFNSCRILSLSLFWSGLAKARAALHPPPARETKHTSGYWICLPLFLSLSLFSRSFFLTLYGSLTPPCSTLGRPDSLTNLIINACDGRAGQAFLALHLLPEP